MVDIVYFPRALLQDQYSDPPLLEISAATSLAGSCHKLQETHSPHPPQRYATSEGCGKIET